MGNSTIESYGEGNKNRRVVLCVTDLKFESTRESRADLVSAKPKDFI